MTIDTDTDTDDALPICADCNEPIRSPIYYNTHDEPICTHCDDLYTRCDDCGDRHHDDDLTDGLCASCCEAREEEPSGPFVYPYEYRLKPDRALDRKTIYYGLEIEVEVGDYYAGAAESIAALAAGYGILKADGSLVRGFELVTYPRTLTEHRDWWRENGEQWASLCRQYSITGHNNTCGIHCHVSRAPLSQLQIGKILVLANSRENQRVLEIIAQRPSSRWAEVSNKRIADAAKTIGYFSRYEAINLQNKDTIEFRIYKGNVLPARILKCLENTAAMTAYCGPANVSCRNLSIDSYIQSVDKKAYPNLHQFLVDRGVINSNQSTITEDMTQCA